MSKQLTLFQRLVRLAQTSYRRWNHFLLDRMPGLPNPPEIEESLRRPVVKDLWHLTPQDYAQALRNAWQEYRDSFKGMSDEEYEENKLQVKQVMMGMKSKISGNVDKNKEFLEDKLQGTKLLQNVREITRTTEENVEFLKQEMDQVKSTVDVTALKKNVEQTVQESMSKEDVVTTLQTNIHELADMAKAGRKAALEMNKQDVDHVKATLQQWFADKLVVGQVVILNFINGYREGKELELTRDDALLVTFAKKTASEQKDKWKGYIDKFIEEQRAKHKAEEEAEHSAVHKQQQPNHSAPKNSKQTTADRMHQDSNATPDHRTVKDTGFADELKPLTSCSPEKG